MKNRGNVKAQKKRRKERMKNLPPKQPVKYELIDGNYSFYPVAECKSHKGYLTQGLVDTHRCVEKNCCAYKVIEDGNSECVSS